MTQLRAEPWALTAARLRSEGLSYRAIAARVGVSKDTVARTLSGSLSAAETPATVRGLDGKSYPAARWASLGVASPGRRYVIVQCQLCEVEVEFYATDTLGAWHCGLAMLLVYESPWTGTDGHHGATDG